MNILEYFLLPCHVAINEAEAQSGIYTVIMQQSQPYRLLGKEQKYEEFWAFQISDMAFLDGSDQGRMYCVLEYMHNRNLYKPIIILDPSYKVLGVIDRNSARDLRLTLKASEQGDSDQFGKGISPTPAFGPSGYSTTAYCCPDHPNEPIYCFPVRPPCIPTCRVDGKPLVRRRINDINLDNIIFDDNESDIHGEKK